MDINNITNINDLTICPWCNTKDSFINKKETTTRIMITCNCGCKVVQVNNKISIHIPTLEQVVKSNITEKWLQN